MESSPSYLIKHIVQTILKMHLLLLWLLLVLLLVLLRVLPIFVLGFGCQTGIHIHQDYQHGLVCKWKEH